MLILTRQEWSDICVHQIMLCGQAQRQPVLVYCIYMVSYQLWASRFLVVYRLDYLYAAGGLVAWSCGMSAEGHRNITLYRRIEASSGIVSLALRCCLLTFMTQSERIDPTRYRHGIRPALRLTGFLGFCAGFMLAYQQSSCEYQELSRPKLPQI